MATFSFSVLADSLEEHNLPVADKQVGYLASVTDPIRSRAAKQQFLRLERRP
jgi:hypothetical protein